MENCCQIRVFKKPFLYIFTNVQLRLNFIFMIFVVFKIFEAQIICMRFKKNSKWVKSYVYQLLILYVIPNFPQVVYIIMCIHPKCCNLNLGLATKVRACKRCGPRMKPGNHIPCFRECRRVWRNEPTHSQMGSHFGSWSPYGLLNLQGAIVGVKTHWIEKFFIKLESSWNVYVWNGLAWLIKT
jgi:hypothetical protein